MSPYASQADKRSARLTWTRRVVTVLLLLALASILDPFVFRLMGAAVEINGETVLRKDTSIEGEDWYRLIRVVGSYWTWLAVAALFVAADLRTPKPFKRALFVLIAVAIAGIDAEILKLIVARERPVDGPDYQGFVFHAPFAGFAGAGNLGFPSSHAAAAFAGAAATATLLPALRPVLLALAGACAASRVAVGAHWLSDAVAGSALGLAAAYWLYPRFGFAPTRETGPTLGRRYG